MADNENDSAEVHATNQSEMPAKIAPLRVWPALLIIAIAWALRYGAAMFQEPSFGVRMTQIMGPGAVSLLVLVWWIGFSRATIKERIFGTIGLLVVAAATAFPQHKSVFGFGTLMFAVPCGMTAFAIGCFLLRSTPTRLIGSLLFALFGFGYWALVRTDEITGNFDTTQRWRWEPTPEDQFLASLDSIGESTAHNMSFDPACLAESPWPGFRGADRSGATPGVTLDTDWNTTPPVEKWRIRVGPGWSSFSIAGDRLFTQEQRGEKEAVVCYNTDTGKQIWIHEDETRFWEVIGGAGPRATPTLTSNGMYTLGANGTINRLDPADGKVVWSKDLQELAERVPPTWGFSSSPLVTDGVVIVHAGGEEQLGLFAFDEQTGEVAWTAPSGNHSYSSAQRATLDGIDCVLMLTNEGLEIFDPVDGKVLGQHEWFFAGYRVVQPLVVGSSDVILGTPMGEGTQRINATWDGGKFTTEEVWAERGMKPYFNDYVQHKGFLYGFDNGIFACVNLEDGTRTWKRGRYGHGQAVLLPDCDLLLVATEKGAIKLLQANPDKHDELASFELFNSRVWNHPVLVGNRLYIRNADEAVCVELATKSE